jgi:DNA-binding transcriptional LysR family regulator
MIRHPSTMALLCFEASARHGSFTRAAQELHLTQGAVSRQVIGLEARLDVPLFLRRRERLALTDAGTSYLEEVRGVLQALERATANLMALKGSGGRLTLSVASSLGNHWLIPRLPGFTRDHPEITFNVATRVGPVNFAELAAPAVDASLEFSDGQRTGVVSEYVMPLQLAPYASPGWIRQHLGRGARSPGLRTAALKRVAPSSLIHHTTVPHAWSSWTRLAGWSQASGPLGREGPRYDLMSMALNAAVAGLGVALLPPWMAGDAVAAGRLQAVSPLHWQAERAYYLVYPPRHGQAKPLQAFAAWLQRQAAADPVAGPKAAQAT